MALEQTWSFLRSNIGQLLDRYSASDNDEASAPSYTLGRTIGDLAKLLVSETMANDIKVRFAAFWLMFNDQAYLSVLVIGRTSTQRFGELLY